MKTLHLLLVILVASIFVGCESASQQSGRKQPAQAKTAQSPESGFFADVYPGTNIFYQFDQGPGCAFFVTESDYLSMRMTGGKRVVVVDGHFPPPAEMPKVRVISDPYFPPELGLPRRDMSLIDDIPKHSP